MSPMLRIQNHGPAITMGILANAYDKHPITHPWRGQ